MLQIHPQKITEHRLHRLAENALRHTVQAFPQKIRTLIRPVSFFIVKMPDPILYRNLEPDTLGLFEGLSLLDPIPLEPQDHPKITIFYMNIWQYARFRLNLYHKQIRMTIHHEVGHYLGWDEVDLNDRGLD